MDNKVLEESEIITELTEIKDTLTKDFDLTIDKFAKGLLKLKELFDSMRTSFFPIIPTEFFVATGLPVDESQEIQEVYLHLFEFYIEFTDAKAHDLYTLEVTKITKETLNIPERKLRQPRELKRTTKQSQIMFVFDKKKAV